VKAGQLDRVIELQHRELAAADQYGQRKPSFSTYANVRARKLDMTSREFFTADATNAERITRWQIRFREDVLQTDRIQYGDLSYDIVQISEIGRRKGLTLFASAAPE